MPRKRSGRGKNWRKGVLGGHSSKKELRSKGPNAKTTWDFRALSFYCSRIFSHASKTMQGVPGNSAVQCQKPAMSANGRKLEVQLMETNALCMTAVPWL